jgi:hypothetical protein
VTNFSDSIEDPKKRIAEMTNDRDINQSKETMLNEIIPSSQKAITLPLPSLPSSTLTRPSIKQALCMRLEMIQVTTLSCFKVMKIKIFAYQMLSTK